MLTHSRAFLAGRESQFGDLLDLLAEVRSGRAAVAVIDGPSGLGKSALLEGLGRVAREQGMAVLQARCSVVERDYRFGVARQLLAPVIGAPTVQGSDATRLAETVLAGLPGPASRPGSSAAGFDQLESLCAAILRRAEDQPVVLAVDDVQWADDCSAQWLAFLVRRLGDIPVLVAAVSRGPAPNGAADLVDELMAHPACRVVQPALLTVEDTGTVLGRALGTSAAEEFGSDCHAMSGGNPALVAALVRELARAGATADGAGSAHLAAAGDRVLPMTLRAMLRRESPVVRQVAGLLAELGADTESEVLQAVTGLDRTLLDHAVTVLESSGLLVAAPARQFCHEQVAKSLAGALSAPDRASAHAEAARALFRGRASAERIAAHIIAGASTGEPWRVEVLREAARSVSERGATATAAGLLRHALAETISSDVRQQLLVELGNVEAYSDLGSCVEHLNEAEAMTAEPEERAEFLPVLALAMAQSGQPQRAAELLDRTAAELSGTDRRLLPLLSLRAVIPDGNRFERWEYPDDRGPDGGVAGRTPEERGLLAGFAMRSTSALDSAEQAAMLAERAMRGFDPDQDQVLTAILAVHVLLYTDRTDSAWRCSEQLRAADPRHWPPAARAVLSATRARLLHRAGELSRARDEAEGAFRLSVESHPYLPYVAAIAVRVLLETEDVEAAQLLTDRLTGFSDRDNWPWMHFLEARAHLRLAQGQLTSALRDLKECGRLQTAYRSDNPGRIAWRSPAALIQHQLKHPEAARELAELELDQARSWGAPVVLARSLRVAALVGPRPLAKARLEDSVELLEDATEPLELARSLVALGTALAGAGQIDAGRKRLRQALVLAQASSATALARRAHHELLATGARPRRSAQVGPDALTQGEMRIARLAAEGLSNLDIAARLFVTRRTVEFHLTHAYRKLGIGGRAGLRAALSGETA